MSRYGRTAWTLFGLLLAAILLLPLVAIAIEATSGTSAAWLHTRGTLLYEYTINSLILAVGVAVLAALLGVPTAWLVAMCRFPGRGVLAILLMMPLAIPTYIVAYIYSDIFAVTGVLQQLLGGKLQLPGVHSLGGTIVVLAVALFPYVYLMCRTAFTDQPACALEAARVLGCSRMAAFRRVALPLARPAMVASLSLVVMESLADYGVAQYYGVPVLATGIFRAWGGLGSTEVACRLALILLLFSGLLMALERFARSRARYHSPTDRKQPLPVVQLSGMKAAAAFVACGIPVLAGFIIPMLYLSYSAVIAADRQLVQDFVLPLWQSFWLAAVTASIAMAIALFMQAGVKIYGGKTMKFFISLVRLGYGVPGVVVAVGILVSLIWLQQGMAVIGISPDGVLVGTLAGLVFAYLVRFMVMPLQSLENGLSRIKSSVGEVVRSMGFGGTVLALRVYLPIMQGSMWTGLLIVFVEVVKELPATLLLRPFDFNTLAVHTYELANDERLVEASWPALAIVLICVAPVLLLTRRVGSSRSYKVVSNYRAYA